tara:strand:- start:305 stop:523 length:219 start_codon:yes stop_codon:yes gene_type:complete
MYVAKVKRPYTSKDENGNTKDNPGWTDIGIANNGGKGITLYPNFQPLVIDGKVEPIFLFPIEKKEASNGQPI